MRVSINTPIARLSVELEDQYAVAMMQAALAAAVLSDVNTEEAEAEADVSYEEAIAAVETAEQQEQRVEAAEPDEAPAELPKPENGYRGFLHMKCGHCHKEKSFHIKWPLKEYRCECGKVTPLRDISVVEARCSCGWKLNCYTNQDADSFELKCVSCGEPVLVKWDFRKRQYEGVKSHGR